MIPSPRISEIKRVVGSHYGLTNDEIDGESKLRSLAYPRQVAMFIARKLTKHSYAEIGRRFGGRNHATVFMAVKQVEARMADDLGLADEIDRIIAQVHRVMSMRTPAIAPMKAAEFAARFEGARS